MDFFHKKYTFVGILWYKEKNVVSYECGVFSKADSKY